MRFATITTYRSGSSHFQRLLDSHPEITARQEDLRKYQLRTKKYLNELYKANDRSIFGFKIMYPHINKEVEDYLKDPNNKVKVIQLIRGDILETALWHPKSFDGKHQGGLGPPLIIEGTVKANIEQVIQRMKDIHKNIRRFRHLADKTIYYEHFVNFDVKGGSPYMTNKTMEQDLYDFLGVKRRGMKLFSEVNKKNERLPNEEIVTNWDELIDTIEREGIPITYRD